MVIGTRACTCSTEEVKVLYNVHSLVGIIIPSADLCLRTGAAVIFAQFPIDQFRAIAWYNIVMGTVLLLLQLVLFRGEAGCRGWSQIKTSCHCPEEVKSGVNNGLMGLFISYINSGVVSVLYTYM